MSYRFRVVPWVPIIVILLSVGRGWLDGGLMHGAQVSAMPLLQPTSPISAPSPSPTVGVGYRADDCEPNDSWETPCPIAVGVAVPFSFHTVTDVDVWSVFLKAGRTYRILALTTSAIDPVLEVRRAGTSDTIAQNDDRSPTDRSAEILLEVREDGWYLIQARNRIAQATTGAEATILVEAIGAVSSPVAPAAAQQGDVLEDNYSPSTAAPIAPGVWYDLTFVCPNAWCHDGDHDFLLLPVKEGQSYAALAVQSRNGADPSVSVWYPSDVPTDGPSWLPGWKLVAANDDIDRETLDAAVLWESPVTGWALIVVAPTTRSLTPVVPNGDPSYRFIAGPRDLPPVADALVAARVIPRTPMVAPSGMETGTSAYQGPAQVRTRSAFYLSPPPDGAPVRWYEPGTIVTVLGSVSGTWVSVRPEDSVLAGWMDASSLVPLPSGGVPSGGVPSGGVPSGGVPSGGVPSGGVPSGGVPSGGVPSGGVPSGGVPSGGVPSGGVPSGGVPSGGAGIDLRSLPETMTAIRRPRDPSPQPSSVIRRIDIEVCRGEPCRPLVDVPIAVLQPELGVVLGEARTNTVGRVQFNIPVAEPWALGVVAPTIGVMSSIATMTSDGTVLVIRVP